MPARPSTARAGRAQRRPEASYGVDAPGFLPIALLAFAFTIISALVSRRPAPFVGAAILLCTIGFFLHTTLRGKFLVWRDLIADLRLRGDERVLDLGCGRGAVLLAVAKRLTTGHAAGVDIWSRKDQSGNSSRAARANAEAEGVRQRVAFTTADMTALPFPPDTFDVIVSNVALHNISGRQGRQAAVDEAVRVLRPGGRLLIADLRHTAAYAARLESLGVMGVGHRGLGWRMWWGGPWGATRVVTATKGPLTSLPTGPSPTGQGAE